MKTYILIRTGENVKEVKADYFIFSPETQSAEFHKTGQDCASAAFSHVDSIEEKEDVQPPA
jgi:hypothetical protein